MSTGVALGKSVPISASSDGWGGRDSSSHQAGGPSQLVQRGSTWRLGHGVSPPTPMEGQGPSTLSSAQCYSAVSFLGCQSPAQSSLSEDVSIFPTPDGSQPLAMALFAAVLTPQRWEGSCFHPGAGETQLFLEFNMILIRSHKV